MSNARRAIAFAVVVLLAHSTASMQSPSFSRIDVTTGLTLWQGVVAGDFNGDGLPDLVAVSRPATGDAGGYFLAGLGNGSFAAPVRVTAELPVSLATADVNGDQKLDLVYLWFGLQVQLGNGDGTFANSIHSPSVASPTPPAIADVNNDHNLDLVFATQEGLVSVSLGNGDGSFDAPILQLATTDGGRASRVAAGDLDRDGNIDLVAANIGWPDLFLGARVEIFRGHGDGAFHPPVAFPTGTTPLSIVVTDFTGDGVLDLAVTNYQGFSVSVLIGVGDGTFLPAADYPLAPYPGYAASADFTGDGHTDIAVCDPLSVLTNSGDGTFAAAQTINPDRPNCLSIAAADFNLDGRPDLAVAHGSDSGTISIYLNTTAPDTLAPAISVSTTPSVLWAPDGKPRAVVLSGTVTDAGIGVDPASVRYEVIDEYGTVQPSGTLARDSAGSFSVSVTLTASRRGTDHDGRTYTILVHATDLAGNASTVSTTVVVPHHPAGGGSR